MSQVPVIYDYVYFSAASGRTRQPRSTTGPGGLTLISTSSPEQQTTGDPFGAQVPQSTQIVAGVTYQLAFANISGGIPQGQTAQAGVNWLDFSVPSPVVTVANSPIVVLVVYVPPPGGSGPGGATSGASIDSFDETIGALFSDTFVSVAPDAGGVLTGIANVDGFVDTSKATETVTALSPTQPTGVDFEQWVNLYPPIPVSIAGRALTVTEGTSPYAFAMYKSPPPPPPLTTCEELLRNYHALQPKTNIVLLEYYAQKMSACPGPQYAAAVAQIQAIIAGLEHRPLQPVVPIVRH